MWFRHFFVFGTANFMLCTLLCLGSSTAQASGDSTNSASSPASISIGTLQTKGEEAALSLAAELKEKFAGSIWETTGGMNNHPYYLKLKPTFDFIKTADNKFDSGYFGGEGFAATENFIFPYSLGIEAARNFQSYAGIAELGLGWQRLPDDFAFRIGALVNNLVAAAPPITLQAGYKFAESTNDNASSTLNTDRSSEKEGDAILRIRGEVSLNTKSLGKFLSFFEDGIGGTIFVEATPHATGWFDAIDGKLYHSESLSLAISGPKHFDSKVLQWLLEDKSIDVSYTWGSGAPLFNRGEFFAAALKMKL